MYNRPCVVTGSMMTYNRLADNTTLEASCPVKIVCWSLNQGYSSRHQITTNIKTTELYDAGPDMWAVMEIDIWRRTASKRECAGAFYPGDIVLL